jgi:hypothetical protein
MEGRKEGRTGGREGGREEGRKEGRNLVKPIGLVSCVLSIPPWPVGSI